MRFSSGCKWNLPASCERKLLYHKPDALTVRFWLENGPKANGNLRIQVDIDPQSFF